MHRQYFNELVFYVNGKKIVDRHVDPVTTLLHYLRSNSVGLTGTKLGCGEGGCGACTVMVSKYDRINKKINHYSVVSCLVPICSLHGCAVVTTEGIGSVKNGLHPVQERLAKSHGTQCGFCSPGMVMSMYTRLRNNPQPSTEDVEMAIQGNLCRCTGYRGILDGFMSFTKEQCEMGDNCCKNQSTDESDKYSPSKLHDEGSFKPLDQSQEIIFPSELQNSNAYDSQDVEFRGAVMTWYRPTSLQGVLELQQQYPESHLVSGYTKLGFDMKSKEGKGQVLISVTGIPELLEVEHTDRGVRLGAAVTMSRLDDELKNLIQQYPEYQTRSFVAISEMLKRVAGKQIRNMATVGGSIMAASANSDLNTLLVAFGAVVEVVSNKNTKRHIPISSDGFFTSKGRCLVRSDEMLVAVFIPFTQQNECCNSYKQARRHDAAFAIVNAGMRVVMEADSNVVKEAGIVYGGMGPVTAKARETMQYIVGKRWEDEMLPGVYRSLIEDLPMSPGAVGGMEKYRQTVALGLFFKFYLTVKLQLQQKDLQPDSSFLSATAGYVSKLHSSTQTFQEVGPGQLSDDPVGRPMVHMSAMQHTTGETQYIDDIPQGKDESCLAFVLSTKAHAKLVSVDTEEALSMPGVRGYIDHSDIVGPNLWGMIVQDEQLFASDMVLCQGQPIGAILADTKEQAQSSARKVKINYDELEPILTIQDAINSGSFLDEPTTLQNGDTAAGFQQSDHVIQGECYVGGQVHFYMETQSVLVVPARENDEMEVFASTQNNTHVQATVASALGVPRNRITVRVKRAGGGYGGKMTKPSHIAACTAVAAKRIGRPVRSVLDRDEDTLMTGTRHPVFAKYKVGFTHEGKLLALEVVMYLNAGMSMDLSGIIATHVMQQSDNAYKIPNVRLTSHVCKTNIQSNTGFRGFGGPQAAVIAETWIQHVATTLGIAPRQVQEINLFQEGDYTFYKHVLSPCYIQKCWDLCIAQSDYSRRFEEVKKFNGENMWTKRGISMTPLVYPIAFKPAFLNQGGALVHVYTDGSVLLAHGGVEMGQGLHTKMIQVASRALGVPASKIHTSETATNTVPNVTTTAASAGSDINGMAVLYACETICQRLEPVKEANPAGSWEDWITAAYFQRISLSATGFYKMYDDYTDTLNKLPYCYFTYSAACSEVEIDCLTGEHQVLRTDIVMDVGQSLNPAIDIGQIEGAFVQGYGMMMLEEIQRSPTGHLYSRGPGTYTVPMARNIPGEFNVTLLKGSSNEKAVYSSKGVGEPPLLLAVSVFCAVKEAIMAARADAGHHGNFRLDSPATPERIRLACEDQFTKMVPDVTDAGKTPWCVGI